MVDSANESTTVEVDIDRDDIFQAARNLRCAPRLSSQALDIVPHHGQRMVDRK